ncbi:hypothetical protein FH608_048325 [Nonomuraea phyllanthi]|uniref:Cell division protein ZapB n=1 Tax=Nonomuraea phyllanthi TaxID=2219224 RepID=A0A5C4V1K9_9ACTN|nr:hypothetical protein [Nonomuraea phyllanthi]KAB8184302.1 hypothetical protein FH608_048325 [Nonomuraea phyllanthi]
MSEQPIPPSSPSIEEIVRQLTALQAEVAEVRATNVRLRELLTQREAELAAAHERIARQAQAIREQDELIKQLRAEVVALRGTARPQLRQLQDTALGQEGVEP